MIAAAVGIVAGPAVAEDAATKTADDRAEATLAGSEQEVSGRIASACLDNNWTIAERTEFKVVCEGEEVFMPLYGNMRIKEVYTFNLIGADGITRVRGTSISQRRRPIGNSIELEGSGGEDMAVLLNKVGNAP